MANTINMPPQDNASLFLFKIGCNIDSDVLILLLYYYIT